MESFVKDADMSLFDNRKKSFLRIGRFDVNSNNSVNFNKLSEAGFYYCGEIDYLKCFYYSIKLWKWLEKHDPFTEHRNLIFDINCTNYKVSQTKVFEQTSAKYNLNSLFYPFVVIFFNVN